jgi:hypothetical protein
MFQRELNYVSKHVNVPNQAFETTSAKRSTMPIDNVMAGVNLATDTF